MPSNKHQPDKQAHDKRGFFRITDDLILDYKQVDAYTADSDKAENVFPDSSSLSLFAEFKRIDSEAAHLLASIGETNRALADYLGTLNRKMDILTQKVMADRHQNDGITPTRVNISEGGIAFQCDKALYKGSHIALRLMFIPSFVGLATFATVIRCEEQDNSFHIAAKFHRLSSTHQQILSRQIMQQQISAKRESTSSKDTPS
jgi:PilZ domain